MFKKSLLLAPETDAELTRFKVFYNYQPHIMAARTADTAYE